MPRITTRVEAVLPGQNGVQSFSRPIHHSSYQGMKRRLERLLRLHQVVVVIQNSQPGSRTVMMNLQDPSNNWCDGVIIDDPNVAYSQLRDGFKLIVACTDR